jgi:hypothetical protein
LTKLYALHSNIIAANDVTDYAWATQHNPLYVIEIKAMVRPVFEDVPHEVTFEDGKLVNPVAPKIPPKKDK